MTHVHGGNITEAKRKYNLQNKEIIDFSANINFLGPPPAVKKILQGSTDIITNYPEPQSETLKGELAEVLKIGSENIIIGNGAVEIIYQLLHILQPGLSLIPAPAFSEYAFAVKSINKKVERILLKGYNNFKLDVNEYISYLERVDMAFLCNPHNPVGNLINKVQIMQILEAARRKNVWLVIDEAFIDFIDKNRDYTPVDRIKEYNNLIIIRSLTKFFAIPGLRLGYGLASPEIIAEMEMKRDPWSVNILAQMVGKAVLKDKKYREKSKMAVLREKGYLYRELKKIKGIKPYKPAANFIFIKLEADYTAGELKEAMGGKGILIRDCSSYYGLNNKYIRIAVKSREDNDKLLNLLKQVFQGLS